MSNLDQSGPLAGDAFRRGLFEDAASSALHRQAQSVLAGEAGQGPGGSGAYNGDTTSSGTAGRDTTNSNGSPDLDGAGVWRPASSARKNSASALLPPVEILHTGWWEGVENVATELGIGALDEITHHPGRVVLDAAIGFGAGMGMAMATPAVAIGAGAVMAGLSIYEVATHAGQWYADAAVVASPENHDWIELARAKRGVEAFGGGAVDVAAGVAGGIGGAKFAQTELFADLKGAATEALGKAFSDTYFDQAGRPIKLPLPGQTGSAYIRYDQSGQMIEVNEKATSGWSSIFQRQTDADGAWTISQQNVSRGVYTEETPFGGKLTLSADGKSLTIAGNGGTEVLRAGGGGTWTQTAEQVQISKAWAADLQKQMEAMPEPDRGAGIGAAGIGLGMLVR